MLKVWGRCSSLNLQKVMWLVGEVGLWRSVRRNWPTCSTASAIANTSWSRSGELYGRLDD